MQIRRFLFGNAARDSGAAAAPVALTIGNFDSVHRGHQGLIRRLKSEAEDRGLQSAVLTFDPHPREFLTPNAAPLRLSSFRDKLAQLRASGVDQVYVARFDRKLADLDAGDFVRQALIERIGVSHVLIGDDFCFGRRRQGNLQLLESMGAEHGFDVSAMDTLRFGEERVSSSRIRDALARGDTKLGEQLLGRPYAISGRLAGVQVLGHGLVFSFRLDQASLALGGCHEVVLSDALGRMLRGIAYVSPRQVRSDGVLMLRIDVFPNEQAAFVWTVGTRLQLSFRQRYQAAAARDEAAALQLGQPG